MIAVYHREGSFSDRWLQVCAERHLPHMRCNLFADDLLGILRAHKVSHFLGHPPMADRRTHVAAHAALRACSAAGLRVFPGVADFWHFDDKIAQRYLFEALAIPTPTTHVFLDPDSAMAWIDQAAFPTVFKLRAGAGSVNVALLKSKWEAVTRVQRMFGRGYPATDALLKDISTKIRLHRAKRDWIAVARRLPQTARNWLTQRRDIDWERGYAYFQEFIPANDHDTRVTIIGDRAFAFRRMVRPGDFRASGSGSIDYDPDAIDPECIRTAFDAARKVGTSCIAFDFVRRPSDGVQLIIEMSFAFKAEAVFDCAGHWSPHLQWHSGHVWPQDAILEDIVGERWPA